MANALGYVSETKAGFEGTLAMMNLNTAIRIEKNGEKAAEGQPDFRIFAGETSTEIGGGWMRKAKSSGREYVSLTLADPQIGPRRIYANLAPVKGKKGRHVILWNPKDWRFQAPRRAAPESSSGAAFSGTFNVARSEGGMDPLQRQSGASNAHG